jgi:sec-independent protein translocase protein TatA
MGSLSVWHWLIFLVVALLLFGGSGKISSIMGDVAKGIKSFKKGMTEDDTAAAPAPAQDPFKKEEPKALDGATTAQAGPAAQPAAGQPAAQVVNKVS